MFQPRLFLFDIDGTLLRAGILAVDAYQKAFQDILGVPYSIRDVPCAGRTDPSIVRDLLYLKGHPPASHRDLMPRIFERFVFYIENDVAQGVPVRILEGAHQVLSLLQAHPEAFLALLTGNLERGAFSKLSACGLAHFFPTGAFGSDNEDRNQLGPLALERARSHYGISFPHSRVLVVGDAPADIRCARCAGFQVVAIASGVHERKELEQEKPDFLLDKLDLLFFQEILSQ